jgi:hypothetical protein
MTRKECDAAKAAQKKTIRGAVWGRALLPYRCAQFFSSKVVFDHMIFFAAWMCKCRRVILMASLAIAAPNLASTEIVKVPMTAERWQSKNATTTVGFIAREGFPQSLMG